MDNTFKLYADGIEITIPETERHDLSKASSINLSGDVKVIAVDATDHTPPSGILASHGNGIVTDSSWKCVANYETGWNTNTFDDRHWPPAFVIGPNSVGPWGAIKNISSKANWIWTTKHHTQASDPDKHIYCRKTVSEDMELGNPRGEGE